MTAEIPKVLTTEGVDAVRPIRDEIRTRIEGLIASLVPAAK